MEFDDNRDFHENIENEEVLEKQLVCVSVISFQDISEHYFPYIEILGL